MEPSTTAGFSHSSPVMGSLLLGLFVAAAGAEAAVRAAIAAVTAAAAAGADALLIFVARVAEGFAQLVAVVAAAAREQQQHDDEHQQADGKARRAAHDLAEPAVGQRRDIARQCLGPLRWQRERLAQDRKSVV